MTEAQVGFLFNIAASVSRREHDETQTLLKSYYLMRCKEITRGYGLPNKYFSPKIRCPNCCIEWKNNTEIKVRSIKLSKRQRQRLKSRKVKESKKAYVRRRADLLHSNEIEQICTFCKQSTVTPSLKPQKQAINHQNTGEIEETEQIENETSKSKNVQKPKSKNKNKKHEKVENEINVYSNALDVFSMQNKNNALPTIKDKPKVIKNSKKKKDKFAGLCQKAVLTSAKLKGKDEKQNKLSLFLKPSS